MLTHFDQYHDEWSVFDKLVHSQRFDPLVFLVDAIPFQLDPTKNRFGYVKYWKFSIHCLTEHLQIEGKKFEKSDY